MRIFTSGLDLTQPISVQFGFNQDAPVFAARERTVWFGSVVGLEVKFHRMAAESVSSVS